MSVGNAYDETMLEDTAGTITRIVRAQFDLIEHTVKPQSSFVDDFGADSLQLVQLTLRLEETFDIGIDVDDVAEILTVRDAIEYVENKVAARIR